MTEIRKAALSSLIEQARGPSRELDREIALALGWQVINQLGESWFDPDGKASGLPAYTGSLDAAMTLLPAGCDEATLMLRPNAPQPNVTALVIVKPGRPLDEPREYRAFLPVYQPALALVSACLAALSLSKGEE